MDHYDNNASLVYVSWGYSKPVQTMDDLHCTQYMAPVEPKQAHVYITATNANTHSLLLPSFHGFGVRLHERLLRELLVGVQALRLLVSIARIQQGHGRNRRNG